MRAADLLRRKIKATGPEQGEIAAAQYTPDMALDRLQLALACSKVDHRLAARAVAEVHQWVHWLIYGGDSFGNMIVLYQPGPKRDDLERRMLILTEELRVCAMALELRHDFRVGAIEQLRIAAGYLRVMSLALRQRDRRRRTLREFAKREFLSSNRAQALVNTVAGAIRIVRESLETSLERDVRIDYLVMLDLFAVIIGRGMTSGRLLGDYYSGTHTRSGGFKPELQDREYQAQHALAGIWIGYNYGFFGQYGAMFMEWYGDEPQDVECYAVTCPLGRELNAENLDRLPAKLARAIGDRTVISPP